MNFRAIAVLNLSGGAAAVLERGDAMLLKVTNNGLVPNLNPTAATFKIHLDDLRAKQSNKGHGTDTTTARNDALTQVKRDMENIRISVQQAADANLSQAAQVITSAGLFVKKVTVRVKPDFEVVQGPTSGSATARVRSRGRHVTYFWQYGDGKTWLNAPPTRKAKTTIDGLTPGTTYSFRFQVLTKAGLSDWSQVVIFLVK